MLNHSRHSFTPNQPLLMKIAFTFLSLCLLSFLFHACSEEKPVSQYSSHHITLQKGALILKIAPDTGARVASLQYHGQELLSMVKDKNAFRWGSTVWPSPQADWNWPPPEVMDRGIYEVTKKSSEAVHLKSPLKAYKDLQVTKRFKLLDENNIQVQYNFENKGDTSIQVGIWEVTRIPYAGQVFWKTGTAIETPTLGLNQADSISFFELKGHKEPGKLFIKSSEAWVAYQYKGIRLTKQFDAIPLELIAPEQAPIEVYYEPVYKFAEIEEHGPYTRLAPGAVTTFELLWSLEKL